MYPGAILVAKWCDFRLLEMPVEVKECFMNSRGGFTIQVQNHERLVKEGGMYFFVLKMKLPGGIRMRLGQHKWIIPSGIVPDETHPIYQENSHYTRYEDKEIMKVPWADYFEDNRYGQRPHS